MGNARPKELRPAFGSEEISEKSSLLLWQYRLDCAFERDCSDVPVNNAC